MSGQRGPVAGILAGLERVPAGVDWLLSVPGDTPFLPPDLLARLGTRPARRRCRDRLRPSGGRLHPVVALWPVALAAALRAHLGSGQGAVAGIRRQVPAGGGRLAGWSG